MKVAVCVVAGVMAVALAVFAFTAFTRGKKDCEQETAPQSFRMMIDDAFGLKQPGSVVVVGLVSDGAVQVGDTLVIQADSGRIIVVVDGIELGMSNPVRSAEAGDRIGLKLVGADEPQVSPGVVLSSP